MGGTVSMKMVKMSKEIWNFLFQNGITITAEYLPGSLNVEADWESRNARAKTSGVQEVVPKVRDTNNRPVCIETFKTNSKPDPYCLEVDAMQQEWPQDQILYAFPPFSLINKVLKRVVNKQISTLILITPAWQSQVWYPQLLNLSKQNPVLLPQDVDLLKGV